MGVFPYTIFLIYMSFGSQPFIFEVMARLIIMVPLFHQGKVKNIMIVVINLLTTI